jgi:hypothetical protein
LSSSELLWTRKLWTATSRSRKWKEGKKVVEGKVEKLDLWKKEDKAKKKFEKLEKSKECKVKKEMMTEEKMR